MAESRALPRVALGLALLIVVVGGWHYLCIGRIETNLNLWASKYEQKNRGSSVAVELHPFSNLVEVRVDVKDGVAGFAFLLGHEMIEATWERELRARAREKWDVYAMLIPYQVSLSME